MRETLIEKAVWHILKFRDAAAFEKGIPFEIAQFEGNLLLNEGINDIWNKVEGTAGTAFNNANANLGVGDDSTAAAAAQTGLQAAVNKLYKGMEAAYPQAGASQQIVFQSVFDAAEANFDWEEFTVANAANDAGVNLNRKVSSQGTKANPQVWTLTLTITLS